VHGCGGFFGTVMLGALAEEKVYGEHRSASFFFTQFAAAAFTAVYSMGWTYILLKFIQFVTLKNGGLKPTDEEQIMGIDMAIHGEAAYKIEMTEFSPKAARQGQSPRGTGASTPGGSFPADAAQGTTASQMNL
jgi:ammonia channel protein AmtB